jgi:threonyl-tRNA synthetase
MRLLQLDVDSISYELIEPEASVHEESSEKSVTVNDALVLLVSVEKGDDKGVADAAIGDVRKFMARMKRKRLVIYPFAHLSSSLAGPAEAMQLIGYMYDTASKDLEVKKAPFGWNKKLSLSVKGHPLAEQSRSYGLGKESKPVKAGAGAAAAAVDTSIVKKSDWSGLPEADHRTIGEKLDLYSFQEVSPAMVYWHGNGYMIYRELVRFIREKEAEYDYSEISTPAIANIALWHVSGHNQHYSDDMFVFDASFGRVGLKPMNCPSAILIYKSRRWSYKELPFRTATFDKLYRSELSGAVTGLFRVKELTQDDGHIFLREDQVEGEITKLLQMIKDVYAVFGMKFKAKLSTMPDDHAGDDKTWERATNQLRAALEKNKMEYEIKDKEGSFYAPKIDFDVYDSVGRAWQCATIQADYQMPAKFKIEYADEDGKQATPVILHRAVLGSLERFIGVLVEHYQGKFPLWLAPVQIKVISISEQSNAYAETIHKELKSKMIRTELDVSDKTLEYKIREAQLQKIPVMLVIGKKEQEAGTLTVRSRDGKQRRDVKLAELESLLERLIRDRVDSLEGIV